MNWTGNLSKYALAFFAALAASAFLSASAQTSAPESSRRILLPMELVAGRPATLAVTEEGGGAGGRLAAGVAVVLSSGNVLKTDESGRAHFLVPPQTGILFARIPGDAARAVADVIPEREASLRISHAPAISSLKAPVAIFGSAFEGDADRNTVSTSYGKMLVGAASPAELILFPRPNQPAGATQLTIEAGGAQTASAITFITVGMHLANPQIAPGKKNHLLLSVSGTENPVELDVENLSPGTWQFSGGARKRLRTSGGAENSAKIEIRGVREGRFVAYVKRIPPDVAMSPDAAADFLGAALKIAPAAEKSRIAKIIKKLNPAHADISGASRALANFSSDRATGDFAALLRSAREALLGHE